MAMATSSIPFSKLSLLGSWNALSASNHSAGNFAMDAGNQEAFDIILNSGIFFDTYGEYYKDLREFHQHLPKLLRPGGDLFVLQWAMWR
ncbi:unnamed protein product [Linum tenue]|uniref:Uncharacterized protein n=1 Tax=Linum tenue TaxID=586396 RepID=A0AAV0MZW2_9ROSI|nr:unnamed protein product [Linum tenue]